MSEPSPSVREAGLRIRLVVIDQHEIARLGLAYLAQRSAGISLVGQAATVEDGRGLIAALRPSVVTIGAEKGALNAAQQLRVSFPDVGLVLITMEPDEDLLARAASAGLSALVSRAAPLPTLAAVIRQASQEPARFRAPGAALLPRARRSSLPALSAREQQVLARLPDGETLESIADALDVSRRTVKTYVSRIYTKLQVQNRAQAVIVAARHGLLPPAA
ncbi:response regulator transcription factor [Pilimelia columellifera]|uniref:Response regulator transcription factor n=1 Tax=Pilimelia columellifera subsp. columellifera TaxID=706583 RepID=A0ABN3N7G1_9ACTN